MKYDNQKPNVFVQIIETIRSVDRGKESQEKGILHRIADWCFIAGIVLFSLGFAILYTLNRLFSLDSELAKSLLVIVFLLSLILILISVLLYIILGIYLLFNSHDTRDTFGNRARFSYPNLTLHTEALIEKFSIDELESFSEWAGFRIRMETRIAILIGGLIAAMPKISDLYLHFQNEVFGMLFRGESEREEGIDIELFPLSLESIAFLVLFFVFVIQFIAFRWSKIQFHAKYAAQRLKNKNKEQGEDDS